MQPAQAAGVNYEQVWVSADFLNDGKIRFFDPVCEFFGQSLAFRDGGAPALNASVMVDSVGFKV